MALGQITQEYDDPDKLEEVYLDLNQSLRTYIEQCSINFEPNSRIKNVLKKDLCAPYNHLPEAQIETLKSSLNFNEEWHINIISFNYTYSIEKIFAINDSDSSLLGNNNGRYPIYFNHILHIHGTCDSSILLGVNDISQISNESFKTNEDTCDILVKPIIQTAMKRLVEPRCKKDIKQSRLIIVFGMSFGPSDNQWWNMIIQDCLQNKTPIILFVYDTEISKKNQHAAFLLPRYERKFLNHLVKQLNLNLDDNEMNILRNNIFIRYQETGIFNFNE